MRQADPGARREPVDDRAADYTHSRFDAEPLPGVAPCEGVSTLAHFAHTLASEFGCAQSSGSSGPKKWEKGTHFAHRTGLPCAGTREASAGRRGVPVF